MNTVALAARAPASQLREARRQLLDAGEVSCGLLDPGLHASWRRSQAYGLTPDGRTAGVPHASSAQLTRALDHRHDLVAHARPVMELLGEQVRHSDSIVILADARGMLLQTLGDPHFENKAARVALRPGAIWHEQWRGTNAIGTALATNAAVVVNGAEHYLARNGFLTCAASPIFDPSGRPAGVLDVSGDRRGYHPHTLGMVRMAARMIEHELFRAAHGGRLHLRLHRQAEGLGTVTEGLLALSESGQIVGASAAALLMLDLEPAAIGAMSIEEVLQIELDALLATRPEGAPRRLSLGDGRAFWVRADLGRSRSAAQAVERAAPAPAPADALAVLDTGDAAMEAAIERARRVVDKPIALLLQGESGVGKELFARAFHASGARRDAPFVAVNCAALPEALIESELFGYRAGAFTGAGREGSPGRIREAHGGTLFLDEIGDMPLAMQARLLRVLQERQVTPLGGGKPVLVDFRLVCATHRRLRAEVDAGRFREDLYYRVNGLALQLPPLRERSDLKGLIAAILDEVASDRDVRLACRVADAFARYRWPGNLRQLANVLRTACALVGDDEAEIEWCHLPDDLAEELLALPRARVVDDTATDLRLHAERCVRQAVSSSEGNLSEAARRLGISRNTLYRKLRHLDRQ